MPPSIPSTPTSSRPKRTTKTPSKPGYVDPDKAFAKAPPGTGPKWEQRQRKKQRDRQRREEEEAIKLSGEGVGGEDGRDGVGAGVGHAQESVPQIKITAPSMPSGTPVTSALSASSSSTHIPIASTSGPTYPPSSPATDTNTQSRAATTSISTTSRRADFAVNREKRYDGEAGVNTEMDATPSGVGDFAASGAEDVGGDPGGGQDDLAYYAGDQGGDRDDRTVEEVLARSFGGVFGTPTTGIGARGGGYQESSGFRVTPKKRRADLTAVRVPGVDRDTGSGAGESSRMGAGVEAGKNSKSKPMDVEMTDVFSSMLTGSKDGPRKLSPLPLRNGKFPALPAPFGTPTGSRTPFLGTPFDPSPFLRKPSSSTKGKQRAVDSVEQMRCERHGLSLLFPFCPICEKEKGTEAGPIQAGSSRVARDRTERVEGPIDGLASGSELFGLGAGTSWGSEYRKPGLAFRSLPGGHTDGISVGVPLSRSHTVDPDAFSFLPPLPRQLDESALADAYSLLTPRAVDRLGSLKDDQGVRSSSRLRRDEKGEKQLDAGSTPSRSSGNIGPGGKSVGGNGNDLDKKKVPPTTNRKQATANFAKRCEEYWAECEELYTRNKVKLAHNTILYLNPSVWFTADPDFRFHEHYLLDDNLANAKLGIVCVASPSVRRVRVASEIGEEVVRGKVLEDGGVVGAWEDDGLRVEIMYRVAAARRVCFKMAYDAEGKQPLMKEHLVCVRSRNELAEHIGYYDDWIVLPPLGQGRIGYLEPTQEVYQGGPMYAAATPFLELLEHCTSGLIKARNQTGLRQLCSNSFRTVRRMNARSVHCDIKPDNTAVRVRLDKALDDPERHQVVFLDHEGSLPVGTPLGLHTRIVATPGHSSVAVNGKYLLSWLEKGMAEGWILNGDLREAALGTVKNFLIGVMTATADGAIDEWSVGVMWIVVTDRPASEPFRRIEEIMQRCKALSDTRNPTLLKQVVEDILVVRNAYSSVYDWRRYRARYLQNPFLKALDPVLERSLNRPDSIHILGRDSRNGSNVLHTAAAALGHPTTASGDAVDDPSGPPRPHDDVFLPHVPPVGPLRYGVWFGDAPLEAIDQQQSVRSLVHLCFGTSFIRRGDDVRNDSLHILGKAHKRILRYHIPATTTFHEWLYKGDPTKVIVCGFPIHGLGGGSCTHEFQYYNRDSWKDHLRQHMLETRFLMQVYVNGEQIMP